jgi:hypothetical protein
MRRISRFRILLAVPWAVCIAQEVKVVDNPMDGSRSVRIVTNARESYKRADGTEFTPTLEIRCEEAKSGGRSVEAILETGGVLTKTITRRDILPVGTAETFESGPDVLKTKFDEGKPTKNVWRMDPDKDHVRFLTPGFSQKGRDFVKEALKARIVYIAFPPHGSRDDVVSQFDLSGFKAEFEKHAECSVK